MVLGEGTWCPGRGLGIKDIPLQECGLSCPSGFRPSFTCSPKEGCPPPSPRSPGSPEGQSGGRQNRSGSLGVSWSQEGNCRWGTLELSEGYALPHTSRPLHMLSPQPGLFLSLPFACLLEDPSSGVTLREASSDPPG